MKAYIATALAFAAVLSAAGPAEAQVTVTGPAASRNSFPFSFNGIGPSTRYQQVYSAGAFAGPLTIREISFFAERPGNVSSGTFELYLSTTAAPVDGLNLTDFDANLGTATSLFGTFALGGTVSSVLSFVGGPYQYNPLLGNLLLDLRVVGRLTPPESGTGAPFIARAGQPGGNYSRAQNFGAQTVGVNAGAGLDTRFSPTATAVIPEPSTWALLGTGLLGIGGAAARRKRAPV